MAGSPPTTRPFRSFEQPCVMGQSQEASGPCLAVGGWYDGSVGMMGWSVRGDLPGRDEESVPTLETLPPAPNYPVDVFG